MHPKCKYFENAADAHILFPYSLATFNSTLQCFTDHGFNERLMAYLMEDTSMTTIVGILQTFGISMNSLDTMMDTLNDYCGKTAG